jgi:hypothetical protein
MGVDGAIVSVGEATKILKKVGATRRLWLN